LPGPVRDGAVLLRAVDAQLLRLSTGGVLADAHRRAHRAVQRAAPLRDGLRILAAHRRGRRRPCARAPAAGLFAVVPGDEDPGVPCRRVSRGDSGVPGARRLRRARHVRRAVESSLLGAGARLATAAALAAALRPGHGFAAPGVGPQTPDDAGGVARRDHAEGLATSWETVAPVRFIGSREPINRTGTGRPVLGPHFERFMIRSGKLRVAPAATVKSWPWTQCSPVHFISR